MIRRVPLELLNWLGSVAKALAAGFGPPVSTWVATGTVSTATWRAAALAAACVYWVPNRRGQLGPTRTLD